MRLRRLGWAGIELEQQGQSLVVDHLLDPGSFAAFFGEKRDRLISPKPGRARAALVTHLHRDHADVAAIELAVASDGIVLRPEPRAVESRFDVIATGDADHALRQSSLEVHACRVGDEIELGTFSVTATFASDGLGSPQISWLIKADGQCVFHGGDTLWHGAWWDIVRVHGPVDVACLPANGAEVDFGHLQPSVTVPAVMTPKQAVEAARALRARVMVPIHYNRTFVHPKHYRPVADARQQIEAFAAERGVDVLFLQPGQWHDIERCSDAPSR